MFSLQQLIKTTAAASPGGSSVGGAADLYKFLRQLSSSSGSVASTRGVTSAAAAEATTTAIPKQSSQAPSSEFNFSDSVSHNSPSIAHGCCSSESNSESAHFVNLSKQFIRNLVQQRSQDIQRQLHTQRSENNAKSSHPQQQQQQQQQQQTTTKFAMSSLAAEPLQAEISTSEGSSITAAAAAAGDGAACHDAASSAGKKPCFSTGLADILQFMELIGNLKHTKRTGWVLRDVNDCESISGHMYRMSMLTFLLDGSEGLNQIRCMELALVHDLAESLVGDITPFCGVSKEEKRAMEFKAMEDICKLIEPRGKRIMELFEEYEHAQSAESKFVKDLDRLDMVMQAFEYEKRDNCLLKHQEFFDSTEGKFNHPFVKKLVNEIYEQRQLLAKAKGATPPPAIEVPVMEAAATPTNLANGHGSSS
ncbi:uncharacterized protein [Drosophila virilis]|uniref:5'-deoxynucleotidase HDDC2 n=1 Tax=Drosophila virilis TaxID=7244 RepID=B4M9P9_DROVI|nr:uncharacterized protein LOC6633988 [Drosophila virilis]XP_015025356.1 uncharacterized protein LOC6633988 [Drosophila virilis]EDW57925.1 uncharacterized protein Dvir_GJ18362, isoform A [Drosophila virilis]KRF78027.1 uncharacterized protein Dvir_GJ18362, isoform B [Drosophila virilis]